MDRKVFDQALWATWEAIAYDILACDGVDCLPRDAVIETVLDADYVLMYGRLSAEEKEEYRKIPYDQRVQMAKNVFTGEYYGS